MRKYILFFISLILSSCQTVEVKREATKAPKTYREELLHAQKISKANPSLAIVNIDKLLSSTTENSLSDDALYLMGLLLKEQNKPREALRAFSRILDSKYASPLDGKALIEKAKIVYRLEGSEAAMKALNYIKFNKITDVSSLDEIETLRAPLLIQNEQYFEYLQSANTIIRRTKDQKLAQETYKQAQDVLKIKLSEREIKKILDEPALSQFHPLAVLTLTSLQFENDEPEKAIENLEKYSALLQAPEYKSRRDELMTRGHIYTSPNKDVIGVILPLSGKYQFVSQQVLKGLEYSLDLWNRSDKINFKLSILDSEGDPNQVSLAFDEMMKNDKPIAVIGGLISKTAESLLEKAQEYRTPVFILSQKEGLVKNSRYGFQSSQSIEVYTDLIAKIAFEKLGIKKISVLHSKKVFSTTYANAFVKSFSKQGGVIVNTVEYDIAERRALPNAVKKLVGLLTIEGREDEYNEAIKKWRRSSRSRGKTGTPNLEEILKPKIEFDAIFVADGAKNGGLIASTLAYFDVEDMTLLGTHLWNDSALLERGQRFVENAVFASAYFEPNILNSSCGQDFLRKFQEPINPYVFKGIEMGVILSSIYGYFEISSRNSLLSSLKKTSLITHSCLPQGLMRDGHNFSGPFIPLTVKDKSIVLMNQPEDSSNTN